MTISVTCPCGGRFAAQPHLAGKTVRCPNCQQALQVPLPPREPLAPLANPFSDAAAPVEAQLVPPVASAGPTLPQSQDPFGGKATVVSSPGQPAAAPQMAAPYGQPPAYGQPQNSQFGQDYRGPRKKSYAVYYIVGAVLLGMAGFVLLAAFGVYQFVQQLDEIASEDSPPLPVQQEDYAAARTRFETRLTSHGEAPQGWDPLETPPGAAELTYQSDGHALRAYVDPPPADGQPRPGVVFLHGGFAWGEGDWEMSQPYRDQGFIVMSPVLRGENGQPGEFSLYYNEVDDVLAATSAFAELPYVDETQLYIAGHSAGGTLASLTAMSSDRFLAMASFSGSMNQSGVGDWDPDLLVYNESSQRETLMRSPEAFAMSFKCPAQLYYGNEEEWFFAETQRTAATARSAGLNVQTMMVPGDHMSSVDPAMRQSISFFRHIGRTRGKVPSGLSVAPPRTVPADLSRQETSTPDVQPSPALLPAESSADASSLPGRAGPNLGTPPGRIPRPEFPGPPDLSTPNFPRPPTPTPGRPNFPTPRRPGPPGFHQGVVTIEVVDYTGRIPQRISAQRALIRHPWADTSRMKIDGETGAITVPARKHLKVDTATAKQALEQLGFTIGAVTFKSDDPEADTPATSSEDEM